MVRDTLNKIMAAIIVLGLIAGAAWSAPGRNVVANSGGSDMSAFPLQGDFPGTRLVLHRSSIPALPTTMFGCPAGGMCNMSAGLGCSSCSIGAFQDADAIYGSYMIIAFERSHVRTTGQSYSSLLRPPRL
jgi:hypothetical protein